jgi:hypothetical protein
MNVEKRVQFGAIDLTNTAWRHAQEEAKLEDELRRELSPDHVLFDRPFVVLARGVDSDDVLILLDSEKNYLAGVHLTWSRHPEPDPKWPSVWFYRDIQDFIDSEVHR